MSKTGDNGWIGVDLDGTLAHYDGWKSADHIGDPVAPMVERVKSWLARGERVKIFTARVFAEDGRDVTVVRSTIESWCLKHIGQVLPITNVKDYGMIELWDDRAIQVVANTGQAFMSIPI